MPTIILFAAALALIGGLVAYMLAQKPATNAQKLIHRHEYEQAAQVARSPLDRGEALKLLGRFEEAIDAYRLSSDPAAQEGIALAMAHAGRSLDEAQHIMERTIALHPQIMEFQALSLAYILLQRGDTAGALRIFSDNVELLETRFRDDYTDPDPLLAETLFMYGALSNAAGDATRAAELRAKAASWAPGSWFAKRST